MSESTKSADKCAKCGVSNPVSFTKCRRCGKTLQWATAAAPVSVDPLSAPPANASSSSASSSSASPSASSSARSARSSAGAGQNAAIASGAATAGATANQPPQVYTGGPPSRLRDLPEPPPKNMAPFYAGGVVGALVLLFLVMRMISPKPVEAISEFGPHITKGKTFQVMAPKDAGWELNEGAREDGLAGGSRWTNGSAKVSVEADAAGSFMSEGLKLSTVSPTQALHQMEVKRMEEKFGNYEEEPSKSYTGKFGETWYCEFTGTGGLREGKIHGLRATTRSGENRIRFTATCREADWEKLKPGFETILGSLNTADAVPEAVPGAAPAVAPGAVPAASP